MRSRELPGDEPSPLVPWREWVERGLEEAKDYARERPLEALLTAFVSGMLAALLLSRRR